MTSDVTVNNALNSQKKTAEASRKLSEDYTEFLSLLTTQLKNQDPLNPMDSNEFTNQIVNFTGVEQQINTNQKLDDLIAMGLGNSFSSAISYVGKNISYLSSEANFDGQNAIKINYAISEGTPVSTKINIFDKENKLIFSKDLPTGQGAKEFVWDGKNKDGVLMPEGTYTVRVDALDQNQKALKTSTVVNGRVKGIETQNGLTMLLVGERAVSIGSVINVTEPEIKTSPNNTTPTPTA